MMSDVDIFRHMRPIRPFIVCCCVYIGIFIWIPLCVGGASLDYILANDVAPGALLFAPSCETAHFGCVKIQDKAHWEYRYGDYD